MNGMKIERRLAAILAADVVGYSRLIGLDEVGTHAALREIWTEQLSPLVADHQGRIVKMLGDGALVEFASAVNAVECAVAFQRTMRKLNEAASDHRQIVFRIGVNLGDVIFEDNDVFGDGVNIAARLEGQAPEGGILISDVVHQQVTNKVSESFADAGEIQLKNIALPQKVWRWAQGSTTREKASTTALGFDRLPSIAVLPFANMSSDPEQEHFADGLADDILTTLSKLSGLLVIARNSSFVYKDRAVDVKEVGAELGARYILEGSVRKSSNRIRITVQLIDAENGAHVWAERYDRTVEDIFAVQDEITLVLATELQVNLTEGEQARLRYTTTNNLEAWTHWIRGLSYYRQAVAKDKAGQARPHWEKALALDPNSASLNAMLAMMQYVDARFGWWNDRKTAIARGQDYVKSAISLDPENADAYTASSLFRLLEGQFDDAVAEAKRAVELAPSAADTAAFACFVFACSGFPKEAEIQIEKAVRLNPNHPAYYLGHLGNAYRLCGRTDDAIEAFKAFAKRSPGFGLTDLTITYQQTGQSGLAEETATKLLDARPNFTVSDWRETQFRKDKAQLETEASALQSSGLPLS